MSACGAALGVRWSRPPSASSCWARAPPSADDEAWTTEEWVLLILLGVGAVAVFIGATSAAASHSEKKQRPAFDGPVAALDLTLERTSWSPTDCSCSPDVPPSGP